MTNIEAAREALDAKFGDVRWTKGSRAFFLGEFEAAIRADVATDVQALVVASRAVLKWGTEDSEPIPEGVSLEKLTAIIDGDAEFAALKEALAPFEHVKRAIDD